MVGSLLKLCSKYWTYWTGQPKLETQLRRLLLASTGLEASERERVTGATSGKIHNSGSLGRPGGDVILSCEFATTTATHSTPDLLVSYEHRTSLVDTYPGMSFLSLDSTQFKLTSNCEYAVKEGFCAE
jgi:hypothetical protein